MRMRMRHAYGGRAGCSARRGEVRDAVAMANLDTSPGKYIHMSHSARGRGAGRTRGAPAPLAIDPPARMDPEMPIPAVIGTKPASCAAAAAAAHVRRSRSPMANNPTAAVRAAFVLGNPTGTACKPGAGWCADCRNYSGLSLSSEPRPPCAEFEAAEGTCAG